MTNQHNIAEECEHRLDDINLCVINFHNELRADLARYAAHMRQQAERIEKLQSIVSELDQTADGEIMALCKELWFIGRDGAIYKKDSQAIPPYIMDKRWAGMFFSSREAATGAWDIAEAKK